MISTRKRPVHTHIPKNSPYYRMSYRGYISQARLNMAKHLDRCLGSEEYIYFLDGNSFNEEISNLQLASHKELNALNEIRRIKRRMDKTSSILTKIELTTRLTVFSEILDDIRFRKEPCKCSCCQRSIDTRQAEYKLRYGNPNV